MTAPHRRGAVVEDLARLGVRAGDAVMPHVSLRAVGPIEGGAAGLVAALDEAVGPTGTVLVNVGVRDDWSWVGDHPEADRPALLADSTPFDATTTPADPDNGVFAEVFRTTAGTLVSDHPEGRFAARGAGAAALLADVPWDDYYGAGSPLDRFASAGGRVLRLGADVDTVTLIHLAEHRVDLPDKRWVRRHRLVAAAGGPVVRTVDTLDDRDGIADYDVDEDEFGVILRSYLATGRARTGRVGGARSELLDGEDLLAHAERWLLAHVRR